MNLINIKGISGFIVALVVDDIGFIALQTYKVVNQIFVLQNKTISHHGSHQSLLETDNFYTAYWKDYQV